MAKGFYTQGFVILLRGEISLDELKHLSGNYKIAKEIPVSKNWEFGGPTLIIEHDRKVNGCVAVDVVDRPWPDHMGDPKAEFSIFGAWSMGQFGPYAYPGGLKRAVEQSWRWPDAKNEVPRHTGFIRIRMSYIFGLDKDAKVIPQNYAPLKELEFLTGLTSDILKSPHALCYFNPNGEVVLNKTLLDESIAYHKTHALYPLPDWANIRLFNFSEQWLVMDCVGSWQFDLPDHEMIIPRDKFSLQEVDRFIRNATAYIITNGMVIKDRDTMNGPGNINWQAKSFKNGIVSPPRQVLRWLPEGATNIPEAFTKET